MRRPIAGPEFRRLFQQHLTWVLSRGGGGARADFRDVALDGANLHSHTLAGAIFADSGLRDAELRRARLQGADFARADLRGAFLHDADLRNASLRDADLRDAELFRADLSGADLSGALLAGARLLDARLDEALFDRTDLGAVLDLSAGQLAVARIGIGTVVPAALARAIRSGAAGQSDTGAQAATSADHAASTP